jgi:hypothetical protein
VTVWEALPELVSGTQVPVRVWVRPVPQPAVGAQLVYCQAAVPPVQVPKPDGFQL